MEFSLAKEKDYQKLTHLVENRPEIIEMKFGESMNTLLHLSVENNRLYMVSYLLQKGMSKSNKRKQLNIKTSPGSSQVPNFFKDTPLHAAASGGNISIIKLLLNHGAILELKNGEGNSPLLLAARAGKSGMM